jgi:hypothetical protein
LSITSTPPGATAKAGSRRLGKTPIDGAELPAGTYEVVVSKPGFSTFKETVTLEEGEGKSLSPTLEAMFATLQIVTQFEGKATWASISIDGEPSGDSMSVKRKITAGTHQITARREGYVDVHESVTVAAGEVKKIKLVLVKK